MYFEFAFALDRCRCCEVGHFFIGIDELRPAVGITAIVRGIYANEDIGRINTLPGDKVKRKITWPGFLDEGEYDIILTLDLNDGNIIVKESKLLVPGT